MAGVEQAREESWLTGSQVDRRYGISRATRFRWLKEGYLPAPVRFGPGTARWKRSELEAFERRAAADRGERP